MMDQTINGRRRGHGVLEDALPLGKGQIAGNHHTAALIALSQQDKKHFHLLPVVLDIADVIDDQRIVLGQSFQNPEVRGRFDRTKLETITDPSRHLGEALTMTDEAVALSRKELEEL